MILYYNFIANHFQQDALNIKTNIPTFSSVSARTARVLANERTQRRRYMYNIKWVPVYKSTSLNRNSFLKKKKQQKH